MSHRKKKHKNIHSKLPKKGNVEPYQSVTGYYKKHGGSGLTPVHIEY